MRARVFEVVSSDDINRHHQVKDFAFQTKLDYVKSVHPRFHQKAMDALFSIVPEARGVAEGTTMFIGRWLPSMKYHEYLKAIVDIVLGRIGEGESDRIRVDNELMNMGRHSADRAESGPQRIFYECRDWKGIVGVHQSFHRGSRMSLLDFENDKIVVQMRDSIQSHVVSTVVLGFLVGTADLFGNGVFTGEYETRGRDVIFTVGKEKHRG